MITDEYENPIKFEEKPLNKFSVEFPKEFDIAPWVVQKINKPFYVNGNWGNIQIDFIDLIKPSTSLSLFKIIELIKKNTNLDVPLFEFKIKTFNSSGDVIELWVIEVKEVTHINFGGLNYNDDQPTKPFLILKPFNCILEK
jgi:hypothetical protein